MVNIRISKPEQHTEQEERKEMPETKHTKRDWHYAEELRANFSMISDGNRVVCGLSNPIPSGEPAEDKRELSLMRSDAQLITAAPEMYEALKLMQATLTEYGLRDVKKRYSLCVADAAASNAIAKAEGKA